MNFDLKSLVGPANQKFTFIEHFFDRSASTPREFAESAL